MKPRRATQAYPPEGRPPAGTPKKEIDELRGVGNCRQINHIAT